MATYDVSDAPPTAVTVKGALAGWPPKSKPPVELSENVPIRSDLFFKF